MILPEDDQFLYIAKEGLKAPLPDPWKPCKTKKDEIYYYNFSTGESVWDHPCDQYYKKLFLQKKDAFLKKNNPDSQQETTEKKQPLSKVSKQDTKLQEEFKVNFKIEIRGTVF